MNDVNGSGCKYSNDIVPYMYGELSASDSSGFESHLLDCGDCTDEFAVISNARYDVYEWKKLEFDPLPTPRFAIPYDVAPAGMSWVEKIRAAFSSGWTVPTAAFAGLAIVSVFSALMLFGGENQIDVAKNDNTSAPVLSPAASPPSQVESVAKNDVVTDTREPEPNIVPVKIAAPTRAVQKRDTRKLQAPVRREAQRTAGNQSAPRLNDFSEDEDESLRLAQLFDDIDTRD